MIEYYYFGDYAHHFSLSSEKNCGCYGYGNGFIPVFLTVIGGRESDNFIPVGDKLLFIIAIVVPANTVKHVHVLKDYTSV